MEAHLIRTTHFIGITCTAFQHHEVSQGLSELAQEEQLNFRCSTGSHNTSLKKFPLKVKHNHLHPAYIMAYITTLCTMYFHFVCAFIVIKNLFFVFSQNTVALASVTLPATLFPPDVPVDCKLQVVAFKTGSFFPVFGNSSRTRTHSRQLSVNTPVIYVGLGEDEDCIFFLLIIPIPIQTH